MNKIVKGSLLGAAGIGLLVGSFGTYATWTDSAVADDSSITSGRLDVVAGGVEWQDASELAPNAWTQGQLIVPGDTITRTQTFTVSATGANMRGELVFDRGAVDDGAFDSAIDIEVEVDGLTNAVETTAGDVTTWRFDAPLGESNTITTVVTYAFDVDATAQATENATATVGDSTFTLTQIRPSV
ncbi:MAG TPA: alternate-type signal peptide domain-containing protein [Nocardioidaceae bacterium]|nr:alternate-type signal peptide domain-containing protein [Nocardioidaceae bacterium]